MHVMCQTALAMLRHADNVAVHVMIAQCYPQQGVIKTLYACFLHVKHPGFAAHGLALVCRSEQQHKADYCIVGLLH